MAENWLTVNASSTLVAGQHAHFTVYVDDQPIGNAYAGKLIRPFKFKLPVDPTKGHVIKIAYDNDGGNQAGLARALRVDSFEINDQRLEPVFDAVYDRGAIDGKDLV